MAKNLLIVESPAKTRTLSRFLGKDFDILATVGHIRDLPKSKIGIDPENNFSPEYIVIKGKEKVIRDLKKAAKNAKTVFLAPDPDREGEAIAWHVANSIKKGIKADIVRVAFNEITKPAVTEAIANPREINMNLVNAQQARRVLDRIVGYTVSPFLWSTVARNLSAGRVQSVALRLIAEREEAVNAFKPQEYWQVQAELGTKKKDKFTARLYKIDGMTVVTPNGSGKNKISISSEQEVKGYIKELEKAEYVVSDVKSSHKTKKASAPFITSTLQQEAFKKHGFSAKQTMSTAQKLYEGIEIGKEGPVGLITYMRTDSTRISNEALKAVRSYISKTFGKEYLPSKPVQYGKKKSAQDAHEAIRPTYMNLPPDKVKKRLTPQQFKLYSLIWNRFVASQMSPAKFDVETVLIDAARFKFRAAAERIAFDGFLKIYHEEKEPDENGNGINGVDSLPPLKVNDQLKLFALNPSQSFTKPPPRFSEAMLVKELEADGIGRPSTYATIISTLKDRKYVEMEQRKLKPTELGTAVSKILVQSFPDLFDVGFTAEMERELDSIEEGSDDWVEVVSEFYEPFMETIGELKGKQKEIKASMEEKTDIKCEKCGSPMVIKWGRNGRFLACSAYPECKSTKPLPEEEARSKTDQKCEKCGSPMVIKTGRFGRFMACSAYPDCKNTKAITLGIKCPRKDCSGEIIEKQTKARRLFYGCSNYPKCDYASWDMPAKIECPVCHHPFMVLKVSKAKGEYYRCPECKHQMDKSSTEEKTVA
ncbi:MAG: type I DNA topoisomerase [Candidatus Zixiibacteriota bacterium]|nr:MAG: type I DNA topoisomerase [candidate division Zixibacteria bacterium]